MNQIQDNQQNGILTEEIREKQKRLQKLLAESNSEAEFRQRCEKEFEGMIDLKVSWWSNIRIANLYLQGCTEQIHACVS